MQVQLHRFSGMTASSLGAVSVGFPDKCKLALTVLLAKWKPCRSPHHLAETELSRLRVCTYWLCTELFCPRVSLYLGRVSLYLPVEGCIAIPRMFSWGPLELFKAVHDAPTDFRNNEVRPVLNPKLNGVSVFKNETIPDLWIQSGTLCSQFELTLKTADDWVLQRYSKILGNT